jgi:hypothetical protein
MFSPCVSLPLSKGFVFRGQAQTDRIDAFVIAHFGAVIQPVVCECGLFHMNIAVAVCERELIR